MDRVLKKKKWPECIGHSSNIEGVATPKVFMLVLRQIPF